MSGIDEQNQDIPMCPICKKVPYFWILYPSMEQSSVTGWYWLFSDDYIDKHSKYPKLLSKEGYDGGETTLDDITCIVCSDDNNHKFVAEHLVFQEIIECSRRLEICPV